ncbi:hypothetical protein K0M31_004878 [Melipona bicolor]|uniref:Uncharacterized protein n=1 Tax=Melipona bicolor TaxID=60889 RepID=A0AA40FW84_9HYME|nr:hypothetical protein K0M31_004878 [Melipona bicolor]
MGIDGVVRCRRRRGWWGLAGVGGGCEAGVSVWRVPVGDDGGYMEAARRVQQRALYFIGLT